MQIETWAGHLDTLPEWTPYQNGRSENQWPREDQQELERPGLAGGGGDGASILESSGGFHKVWPFRS